MSAFSLDGRLSLDARSFVQGAKKAEQAVGDVGDAFGELPKEADSAGRESSKSIRDRLGELPGPAGKLGQLAGSSLGTAMIAGFGAIGVGALIMQSLDAAFDRRGSLSIMQGQFDLTAQEAKKYGKLAGDLYADGWGEGIDEVQQAVGMVAQKLAPETDQALQSITTSVLAVSKTWGEDFDAIIRSTNQLIQNDLAPNAEAALDLIVGAFQNGGNEAGDLLDTIDEYSQHWSAMGLSGEDALNQIIAGFQGGQRDADKMADAVKEMGIRIREGAQPVRDALQRIGLDADEVIDAFVEGGPAAREAFVKVIEALRNGQKHGNITSDAVALIGTQFEDLGPTALDALATVDGALDDTAGKAEALADTVKATPWEQFKREGENALASLGEVVITSTHLDTGLAGLNDAIGWATNGLDWLSGSSDDAAESLDAAALSSQQVSWWMTQQADYTTASAEASASLVAAMERLRRTGARQETEQMVDTIVELREETDNLVESLMEYITAQRRAADSTIDARESQFDFNDALADANETLAAAESNLVDVARAQDDVAQAAAKNADAQVQLAIDTDTANGKVTSAAQQQDIWNQSMLTSAAQASGPLRAAILDYIGTVNDIPDATLTKIEAALATGDVEEAERILNGVSRTRKAAIKAEADTTDAESHLNKLARNRTSTITVSTLYKMTAMAEGGVAAGGVTLVGEKGAELVKLPRGSRVYTASETRQLLASSARPASGLGHTTTASGSSPGDVYLTVEGNIYGDAHLRKMLDDGARGVAAAVRAGTRQ